MATITLSVNRWGYFKEGENQMKDTDIYELIGAIAKAAIANGGTKLKLSELADILRILDIESNLWDYYKNRTDGPIKKAYNDYSAKGIGQTATDIKNTFIKKDGTPLIP
jgi:hypothetical protein